MVGDFVGERVTIPASVDGSLAGVPGTVTDREPEIPGEVIVDFDDGSSLAVIPTLLIALDESGAPK